MVLRRNFDAARQQVGDGVVASMVAELQFFHLCTGGFADHLVAKADAEHRHLAEKLSHLLVRAHNGIGVSRPVREENPVGRCRQHVGGRRVPRNDRDLASNPRKAFQD